MFIFIKIFFNAGAEGELLPVTIICFMTPMSFLNLFIPLFCKPYIFRFNPLSKNVS